MKSTCVLPPLSDILNPMDYSDHHRYNRQHHTTPYQKPFSLQVSNLLLSQEMDDYEDEPVKAKRKRATPSQLSVLNKVFEQTFFPSTELRVQLGKQLGMSPRTVQIWFQNKRQSIRTREKSVTHIVSPPISPSMQYHMNKPDYISLPPLRLPTFPLTPSSSVQSSPNSIDNSMLFRDY